MSNLVPINITSPFHQQRARWLTWQIGLAVAAEASLVPNLNCRWMPLTFARYVRPTVGDARNQGLLVDPIDRSRESPENFATAEEKNLDLGGATSDITTLSLPKSPLNRSTVSPPCNVDGNLPLLASSLWSSRQWQVAGRFAGGRGLPIEGQLLEKINFFWNILKLSSVIFSFFTYLVCIFDLNHWKIIKWLIFFTLSRG